MILDQDLQLSNAQAITATALSTNTVDLQAIRDMAAGNPIFFVLTITETFNALTALTFQVVTDSQATLATHVVQSQIANIQLSTGELAADRPPYTLPLGGADFETWATTNLRFGKRYLGARYVVAGTAPSSGAVSCHISLHPPSLRHYAAGYPTTGVAGD